MRTFNEVNAAIIEACRVKPTSQSNIIMRAAVSHIRLMRAVDEGVVVLVEERRKGNGVGPSNPMKLYSPRDSKEQRTIK